ncbi:MAG: ABC transporter permease [Calditrichaeota bacterium]|nr:MAG: ABC transporter permease [Calditrichota bacterium]
MNLSVIYNVFIRDFRKQKKRITLTLFALAWGTLSIMLLLGFGEGLSNQLSLNQKGMGESIMVVWGGQTSIPFKGMGKGRRVWLHQEDIEYIKGTVPEVLDVGGEYDRWGVRAERGDIVLSEHINGVTPNYEKLRHFIPIMGGRMINDIDIKLKRRVAFLGWEVAKRLFPESDPVGQKFLLNGAPYTVIGVMKEKLTMGNYNGMDFDRIVIPLSTFKATFGDPYLDNLVVQLPKGVNSEMVEKKMLASFSEKYKFDPSDDRAISVWDTIAGAKEFNNILMGINIFLGIIGGLTLLIAGVGVANIMYVSIKERTREIGIKMAMGARRSYIMVQFLIEALMITFLGGFGGMAISYILTESFKRVPIQSDVLDMMGRPTISLEIGIIVITILGIMGVFSGLFPAMKASSVSPVESLRYE